MTITWIERGQCGRRRAHSAHGAPRTRGAPGCTAEPASSHGAERRRSSGAVGSPPPTQLHTWVCAVWAAAARAAVLLGIHPAGAAPRTRARMQSYASSHLLASCAIFQSGKAHIRGTGRRGAVQLGREQKSAGALQRPHLRACARGGGGAKRAQRGKPPHGTCSVRGGSAAGPRTVRLLKETASRLSTASSVCELSRIFM